MSNFVFSVPHIFQFQFWPHRRDRYVILRQHARFHPYQIIRNGIVTLLIVKMAAVAAQY